MMMIPNNQTYEKIKQLDATIEQLKYQKAKLEQQLLVIQERNVKLLSRLQEYEARDSD